MIINTGERMASMMTRTEEIMKVVAANHGQSIAELEEEMNLTSAQLEELVAFIIAACGQK